MCIPFTSKTITVGAIFYVPGILIIIVCGLWDLVLCFGIVQESLGTAVAVLSLFLLPFLLSLAPLYQGLVNNDWMPLALIYGSGVVGLVLIGIGVAATTLEMRLETTVNPTNCKQTGLAIIVSLPLVFCFFLLYRLLFRLVVSLYANYDPSFGSGFGGLILLTFATSVLGFVSAAIVTIRIFRHANRVALFYGLIVYLVVISLLSAVIEFQRPDTGFTYPLINVAILALTIFSMKLVLVPRDN